MRRPQNAISRAVVLKELRMRLRNRHSLAVVTVYVASLSVVAVVFLMQHRDPSGGQSSHMGSQLFQALAIFQLCLILFLTPASMAGAVSGERKQRTWDLLRVTQLSSFGIIGAKLLAGVTVNALLLFASLPLFGAVFLFGGVTPDDVLRTYLVFVATILLLGITSLFVSVLSRSPIASAIISVALSLLLGFGFSAAVMYLEASPELPGLDAVSQLGSLPPMSPLPPLAQVDPLVALVSVLPDGNHGTLLGSLAEIHHAFGLPILLPLWTAFGLLSLAVAVLLLAISTLLLRFGPPWLNRAAA